MIVYLSLVVSILSLAGFVQGLTGFGFGLVAMALLPSVVDFHLASVLVVLFTLPVSALNFYDNRKHYQWRRGLWLIAGMSCGVPVGVYLMVMAPKELLLRSLGLVLLAFAFNEIVLARRKISLPQWLGFPIGLGSGVLGGAFNMGGPPCVAYLYSRPWAKEEIVALLQVVFITSGTLRLIFLKAHDVVPPTAFPLMLWAAIPVMGAVFFGCRLFRVVEQESLKVGVFLFLAVMGVKYVLWP